MVASWLAIKRVPTLTPSAPKAKQAAIIEPWEIPPAAIIGIFNSVFNQGIKTRGEIGPAWPPAPAPTAITPSAPIS
ncbi:hypothetical protein D3C87_1873700 [compost metagenome]